MERKELIKQAYDESSSITHRHILASINTLIKNEKNLHSKREIRILDAGCGDGNLLYFLHKYLPLFNEKVSFIIYGYDLLDHGVQPQDYSEKSLKTLYAKDPSINWQDRIRYIHVNDAWPFEDKSFEIVISNQVLEHVWNHHEFLHQQARVLTDKGFAIHLFPLREVFLDSHIFLPTVHRMKSWDALYKKIKFYSRLGFGSYRKEKKSYNGDLDLFSRVWADKIYHYCNYPSFSQLTKAAKENHLCITPRFTFYYYKRKFQELLGSKEDFLYENKPSSKVLFFLFKRISGVSIIMYKGEYSMYNRKEGGLTRDF